MQLKESVSALSGLVGGKLPKVSPACRLATVMGAAGQAVGTAELVQATAAVEGQLRVVLLGVSVIVAPMAVLGPVFTTRIWYVVGMPDTTASSD